jgi:hypothetical protein
MRLFHFKHQWKWAPASSQSSTDILGYDPIRFFFIGQKKTRNPDGSIKIKYATARLEYCHRCGKRRGLIDYGGSKEIVSAFHLNAMVQAGHFQVIQHNPLAVQTPTISNELPKSE